MWNFQFSLHRIFYVHSGNRVVVIIKKYMKILNLEVKPSSSGKIFKMQKDQNEVFILE